MIIAAMDEIEKDDEWYVLAVLGKHVMTANSDFDTRSYGYQNTERTRP